VSGFSVLWCSEWFSVCCQSVVSGFRCVVAVVSGFLICCQGVQSGFLGVVMVFCVDFSVLLGQGCQTQFLEVQSPAEFSSNPN